MGGTPEARGLDSSVICAEYKANELESSCPGAPFAEHLNNSALEDCAASEAGQASASPIQQQPATTQSRRKSATAGCSTTKLFKLDHVVKPPRRPTSALSEALREADRLKDGLGKVRQRSSRT